MKYQAPWIGQSEQEYTSTHNDVYVTNDNDEVPEPYRCNIFKKQCVICVLRSCGNIECTSCGNFLSHNAPTTQSCCACGIMPDDGEMSCKYYVENKELQK